MPYLLFIGAMFFIQYLFYRYILTVSFLTCVSFNLLNFTARMTIPVKSIDEDKLYTDLGYRFQYLCDFIGISEKDVKLVHGILTH